MYIIKFTLGFFQHPVEKQITIFLVIIILEDVCTFTNTGGHASWRQGSP